MNFHYRTVINVPLYIFLVLYLLPLYTCGQVHRGTSMLHFIGIATNHKRPPIYTYINIDESNTSLDQEPILIWARAWAKSGWDPRVFTAVEASNHPEYEDFVSKLSASKLSERTWGRFLRYLAMSSLDDGGYYATPQVYPVNHAIRFFDGQGFRLPNEGKFTMHDGNHLSLLSGNKDAWNRITNEIIHNINVYSDGVVVRSLHYKNPEDTISEDSFVDVKYVLSLNQIDTSDTARVCKILANKKATKIAIDVKSEGFDDHRSYFKALKSSLNKCKPTMHTFYELAFGENSKKTLLIEVEEWKKAWNSAGWNTVVLSLEDAKRHPLYEEFRVTFENAEYHTDSYDQMCFYRWLAMASTADGGWMSDFDTYPLNMYQNYDYGFNLPNNGSFTSNLHFVPNLISGSKSEWNRMSELLLNNYKRHTSDRWSDMLALDEILKEQPNAYIYSYDAVELYTVYSTPPPSIDLNSNFGADYFDQVAARNSPFELKRFCRITEGKLAVHFSHASCHKVGFCHNNRGPMLSTWLDIWMEQCLFDP